MLAPTPVTIVQLSDCHLLADRDGRLKGWHTHAMLEDLLAYVFATEPHIDALLLSGDLSQDGSPESYLNLQALLQNYTAPAYLLAGNHDDIAAMQALFLPGNQCQYLREISLGNWLIILLNSHQPEQVAGALSDAELEKLQNTLRQNPHRPVLIALHHPPALTGSAWMDAINLNNAAALLALVEAHSQVKAIVCGHIHQTMEQQQGHVRILGTPSTCFQFLPHSADFALDDKPPGYRRLELKHDGHIHSSVHYLPNHFVKRAPYHV